MTLAERITRHYGGDFSKSQSSGSIPGDGHSTADRSVRVTDAPDAPDGLLVHCYNGADALAEKDRFRRDGLLPEREARPKVEPIFRPAKPAADHAVKLSPGQRITATFEYRRAGRLHYRKHRREPGGEGRNKDFAYDHWNDATKRWVAGQGGGAIAYRCEEVATADRFADLFTAEGEAKADKLASWGLVATSHKDFPPTFGDLLERRRVIILPDADEPGERAAARMVKIVEQAGGEAIVVRLPGLADGGDILDWSGGRADLLSLVAAVRKSGDIEATPYEWIDPDQIPMRPWLFGRWLLRGTVAAVIAPGGIGKTTLLCGIALSMVTGRDLLSKTVWDGAKRVWIWNLEDPLLELKRTMQANALHWGLRRDDLEGWLFVDSAMEGRGLCTAIEDQSGFKLLAPIYEAITAELIRLGIDVLVIDPFVSSHAVEENANSKIDAIAKAWGRVANAANCAIVLVHHTSKAGAADVTALSARGAKALTDACRTALVLNRMDSDEADRLGFDDRERRRYFTVQDDKHNRAPAENADWFRLESVDLGNGGLCEGDSIGVAVPWRVPDPFEGLTLDHLYRVQQEIDGGNWRADWQSPDWAGVAVGKVLGLDSSEKVSRRKILQLLRTWTDSKALLTVSGKDKKGNERKFIEVGKWANDLTSSPE